MNNRLIHCSTPKSTKMLWLSLKQLRTRIWLDGLFDEYGINNIHLQEIIGGGKESSGIVNKWLNCTHAVSPRLVEKVNSFFPQSSAVFELPVFELLRPRRIKRPKLNKLFNPYIARYGNELYWEFPQPTHKELQNRRLLPILLDDNTTLFYRGDLYGFMGILYLLRASEIEGNFCDFVYYLGQAYRAFPGFARTNYFRSYWPDLLHHLEILSYRMAGAPFVIRPRKKTIRNQINSEEHVTWRGLRPRDPGNGRFTELERPYTLATFNDYDT
jgi:hypothetical protein